MGLLAQQCQHILGRTTQYGLVATDYDGALDQFGVLHHGIDDVLIAAVLAEAGGLVVAFLIANQIMGLVQPEFVDQGFQGGRIRCVFQILLLDIHLLKM